MDRVDPRQPVKAPKFDLQGQLGNFLISDIIQMIGLSGKTGTLTLIHGWNSRTITFEHGRITYVASGSRLPSQFELLIRTGRLTRQQIEAFKARRPGRNDEELLGELVERKLLHPADLARCNELVLESAVYTLFQWRNCAFTFVAGHVVKEGGVPVTVDGNHLIIEGTRRVDEWVEISPVVPSVYIIFRPRPHMIERSVPDHLGNVYALVDGRRDVAAIARGAGLSQFDTAKALFELVDGRFVESNPPNKQKMCELFMLCVESIYMKLVLYEHSKDALLFENELNRFSAEHDLTVRMAFGKLIRNDLQTKLSPTELIDLYKLFIGIQNNKLSRMFEPRVFQGLMEGLYRNAHSEIRAMMRMYEFFEIDGMALLDMFGQPNGSSALDTKDLLSPTRSRSA